MKKSVLLALALASASLLAAADHSHHQGSQAGAADSTAPDAAWLAKAKAEYPLKTCVISSEELGGSMGEPVDHVYKQKGQPDRLVRFCCKSCLEDFDKEPAKYLKQIDEAAAKAKSAAKGHGEHKSP